MRSKRSKAWHARKVQRIIEQGITTPVIGESFFVPISYYANVILNPDWLVAVEMSDAEKQQACSDQTTRT